MDHYAGIDVSLECSSVCVVDVSGKIVREGKVATQPEALIGYFGSLGVTVVRIGLEAGPLSQWLYAAMQQAGLAVELLETRHVRDAFKAMPVKSDRNDARGIAQLMRLGWFRPVHCKSLGAQELRAVLTARKLVQSKLHDIENSLRGILRGFGLKVGHTTASRRGPAVCRIVYPDSARTERAWRAFMISRRALPETSRLNSIGKRPLPVRCMPGREGDGVAEKAEQGASRGIRTGAFRP